MEYNASTGKVINITNNGANGITTISADNIYGINVNPINDSNTGITNPIVSIGQFVNPFNFFWEWIAFARQTIYPINLFT